MGIFRLAAAGTRLAQVVALSRWLCVIAGLVMLTLSQAAAHEVRPAIADLSVAGNTADLSFQLALEPLIAGVDLEGLENTDESPLASDVNELRAMSPEDLRQALDEAWPRIRDGIRVASGDQAAELSIGSVEIPEVGDPDLPRDSVLVLQADLSDGDAPVTVGWQSSYGPLVVRQAGEGEGLYTGYLTGGQQSDPIPRAGGVQQSLVQSIWTYVVIGFEHIVPKGLDHILFVLGLFFFSLHLRPLLFQVTAFTLAHTVTLALAVLGIVSVPAAVVEPLIAASIVYVAVENIFHPRLTPWRTAVVFGFGLLHGLGFASVLGDIGLDPARFVTGLISFNVGVELGQLAVIAVAFLSVGYWFGAKSWYRDRIAVPASAAIALMGAWWFVERVFL